MSKLSYTNNESGIELHYEPDANSEIDSSIDETEIERLVNSILEVSSENVDAARNETKFYEYKNLTTWEYVLLIAAKKINMNIKTNRPDIKKLSKKQGIVGTILKGNCLPCFCLCIYMINGKLVILVNDGGHRSRTFVEFTQDKFRTATSAYYLNERGKHVEIGGLLFSEIVEKHPDIAERFKSTKQKFDVYHNITPKEMTEEFQDRNRSSDTNHQEGELNAMGENVVADFTRNTTRIVEGEESNPHKLFRTVDGEITEDKDAIIDFAMGRIKWDTITDRVMTVLDNINDTAPTCADSDLEELFKEGCIIERGRFTDFNKSNNRSVLFENLVKDTDIFLDYIHGTFLHWPSVRNSVKKDESLVTAVKRFLFNLKYHYLKTLGGEDYPKGYEFFGIKDYNKFSRKFHDALEVIYRKDDDTNSKHFGKQWVKGDNRARTIANAFKGYLGKYDDTARIRKTVEWMMEQFDDDYESWGLDVRDAVRLIPEKTINQRYYENDHKCECCGRECDDKLKLEGAHNIPHVAGVQAGGCSGTKKNARAGCYDCNRDMKERVFEEYKESGDWRKFLT